MERLARESRAEQSRDEKQEGRGGSPEEDVPLELIISDVARHVEATRGSRIAAQGELLCLTVRISLCPCQALEHPLGAACKLLPPLLSSPLPLFSRPALCSKLRPFCTIGDSWPHPPYFPEITHPVCDTSVWSRSR
eukprot:759464-Hanusia_phi.AAC.2